MPKLSDEFIARVQSANQITDIFRTHAQLKRQGRNYVCCCPFHLEKTPSCVIYPDSNSFYCFGCGTGGDVITFVRKTENLNYIEAVRTLAERAGLAMPLQNSKEAQYTKHRSRCYEINRETANFYYKNLLQGADRRGLQYFASRKLKPQTIKKYGLGFAPDDWYQLRDYLRQKGFSEEELVLANVCRKSDKGNVYDNFRNRVIFPIVDLRGNVIAFGGRVLDNSKPKYLNTSNTPVFDKGRHLFSLQFAKNTDSNRMILAEGYMDVIAMHQAGFENTVATLGTAITPHQARLIAQYAKEVVIAYDNDTAGQNATQKALHHFSEVGIPSKILHMENAKDPDEFIQKFGTERFQKLIENAGDAIHFQLNRCRNGLDLQTESGQTILLRRSAQVLADIQNTLEREIYLNHIAKELEIRPEVLQAHVETIIKSQERNAKREAFRLIETKSLQRDDMNPMSQQFQKESHAEQQILSYLMHCPEEYDRICQLLLPEDFLTDFHRKIYASLCQVIPENTHFQLAFLNEYFSVEEMGRITGIYANYQNAESNQNAVSECIAVLHHAKNQIVINQESSEDDLLNFINQKKMQTRMLDTYQAD